MVSIKKLLIKILEEIRVEKGTTKVGATTWTYRKYPDGYIDAIGVTDSFTTSNYSGAIGSYYGYYADVNLPFEMSSVDYYCNQKWLIGSGFAFNAGLLGQGTTSLRSYALASSSGSQNCKLILHLVGQTALSS